MIDETGIAVFRENLGKMPAAHALMIASKCPLISDTRAQEALHNCVKGWVLDGFTQEFVGRYEDEGDDRLSVQYVNWELMGLTEEEKRYKSYIPSLLIHSEVFFPHIVIEENPEEAEAFISRWRQKCRNKTYPKEAVLRFSVLGDDFIEAFRAVDTEGLYELMLSLQAENAA